VQLSKNTPIWLIDGSTGPIVSTGVPANELPSVDVERQLVENPTYVTGKLRDIHRHVFQLAPQGSDHDFRELPSAFLSGNPVGNTNPLLDDNFDAIYIRIHGRTGSESPTRIMTHIVSNQEVIYDEAATLCRYHSETVMTPSFSIAKRAMVTGSTKASKRTKYSTS